MNFSKAYKLVCPVPNQLCEAVRERIRYTNWLDGRYNRFEQALKKGFVIEMPYAIKAFYQMTAEDEPLRRATQALVDHINELDELKDFEPIRGEISSLPPGAVLGKHVDLSWFHANSRRMHIPLLTGEKCWHQAELPDGREETWHMVQDHLYELNNRIIHSAGNGGTWHRVHLIVDFMPRGYLAQRMSEGIAPSDLVDPNEPCEWNK